MQMSSEEQQHIKAPAVMERMKQEKGVARRCDQQLDRGGLRSSREQIQGTNAKWTRINTEGSLPDNQSLQPLTRVPISASNYSNGPQQLEIQHEHRIIPTFSYFKYKT